ncbi:unnamed protein product [Closterium sp. Naga37s-1]|nr:unnamed protein product [Closterium sp. Naga37s-1]
MRGSNDRVEVFKLSENLWFAGTAHLPPFENTGDGGASNDGNNSGNHGEIDNSGGDSTSGAGFADGPRDSMESRKEELLARLRGGGMEAANAGGARGSSASARAAAPASAPAPAVDPLEQQTLRTSPPDVALCVGNGYILHTVNVGKHFFHLLPLAFTAALLPMVVYDKQGKQLTHLHLPPYSHSIRFDRFLLPHLFPLSPHPIRPPGSDGCFFGVLLPVVEWRDLFDDAIPPCNHYPSAAPSTLPTPVLWGGANNTYDKFGQTRRRGNKTVGSGLIVAATTTDDPTRDWNVFFIPGSFFFPLFPFHSPTPSNDGINSNPDWRAPLHFNSSRLTMFCMLAHVACEGVDDVDYPQIGTDAYVDYPQIGTDAYAWQMNSTIKPIGPSFVDMRGVVVNPGSRRMWVTFMSAFGKDMSASAVVARLRLSLRLKRKWRPFRVFLERFKVVGVGGGNSLIQPTIALNSHGVGIIAVSLAGRSFYPSAAYATLNANVDIGRIVVTGPGKAPLDDFTGYRGATEMRYGDYMTATVDEEGNAWAAVQYVAGQPRTEWSNWATFVFKVDLNGGEDGGNGEEDKGGNGVSEGNGDHEEK